MKQEAFDILDRLVNPVPVVTEETGRSSNEHKFLARHDATEQSMSVNSEIYADLLPEKKHKYLVDMAGATLFSVGVTDSNGCNVIHSDWAYVSELFKNYLKNNESVFVGNIEAVVLDWLHEKLNYYLRRG